MDLSRSQRQKSTRRIALLGNCGFCSVHGPPGWRIRQLADAQYGVVSAGQLLAAGLTRAQIGHRVADRQLLRVHAGVYSAAGTTPLPLLSTHAAALLAAGSHSALSHLSALHVWELLPHQPAPTTVDITVPSGQRGRQCAGLTLHRSTTLSRRDLASVNRLPVTNPARTLLDCARLITRRELELAVDEALARRLTTLTKLERLITERPHARGRPALAAVLEARSTSTITVSRAEEIFLQLIRDAGLPDPETQVRLHGQSVDAYWPAARFAVEFDGVQWHATRTKFNRDRRKEQILKDHGISLSRVTWEQLQKERLRLLTHITRQIVRGDDQDAMGRDRLTGE